MTLGDSQPLTRRQARELARGQAPESSPAAPKHPSAIEVSKTAPRRAGTPVVTHAGDAPELTLTAFAPRTGEADAAEHDEGAAARPARVLTRRELRALNTAESASPRGAAADADSQEIEPVPPLGQLMSLGIGAGAVPTTTSTLILPAIPHQGGTSGPLTNTGEILITGSFDLPRSLGATGQHPNHFDSSEIDHLVDQPDEGRAHDSAPVSASRAVSTHTSTRGVMTPPKATGASRTTILVVSTAVLAVGVLALFLAGYLFKIF